MVWSNPFVQWMFCAVNEFRNFLKSWENCPVIAGPIWTFSGLMESCHTLESEKFQIFLLIVLYSYTYLAICPYKPLILKNYRMQVLRSNFPYPSSNNILVKCTCKAVHIRAPSKSTAVYVHYILFFRKIQNWNNWTMSETFRIAETPFGHLDFFRMELYGYCFSAH